MPDYHQLLINLTLGTARREPPDKARDWLNERDALDPTADDAEALLAAWTLIERRERLAPATAPPLTANPAPADDLPPPSARLTRRIRLVMNGPYPRLLPEVLRILEQRQLAFPSVLLPELLDRAAAVTGEDPVYGQRLMATAGPRGRWLAGFNPDWRSLTGAFDADREWSRDLTPGAQLNRLRRWRRHDPAAARTALGTIWPQLSPKVQESLLGALREGLSTADTPWLRERLGPKRRGVRRELFRLLLEAGESAALEDATQLAAAALNDDGKVGMLLASDAARELLDRYGGTQKKESLLGFLLDVLPPHLLPDLLGQTGAEFWTGLRKDELAAAAATLLRYPGHPLRTEFVAYVCTVNPAQVPLESSARLTAALSQTDFTELFHDLLDREEGVLHQGGVPRILALNRFDPWSERITRVFVLQLTQTLREGYQLPPATTRGLQEQWRLAIPLFHVSTFGWLRTQLHSATERADAFGKLATETLQVTALRRALLED